MKIVRSLAYDVRVFGYALPPFFSKKKFLQKTFKPQPIIDKTNMSVDDWLKEEKKMGTVLVKFCQTGKFDGHYYCIITASYCYLVM